MPGALTGSCEGSGPTSDRGLESPLRDRSREIRGTSRDVHPPAQLPTRAQKKDGDIRGFIPHLKLKWAV